MVNTSYSIYLLTSHSPSLLESEISKSLSHVLSHSPITLTLWVRHYYPHFSDEETGTPWGDLCKAEVVGPGLEAKCCLRVQSTLSLPHSGHTHSMAWWHWQIGLRILSWKSWGSSVVSFVVPEQRPALFWDRWSKMCQGPVRSRVDRSGLQKIVLG